MKKQKCTNCKRNCDESGSNFAKRTRDIFNILPFICRECTRVQKALDPDEKTLKLWDKYARRKELKKSLKNSCKSFGSFDTVRNQIHINNQERTKMYRARGADIRAKRKMAKIDIIEEEKIAIRRFYDECPLDHHVDHIIPISKGGKHCLSNLQYLHKSENFRKHNKLDRQILEKYLDLGVITIPYLQFKFHLSYETAESIIKELGLSPV